MKSECIRLFLVGNHEDTDNITTETTELKLLIFGCKMICPSWIYLHKTVHKCTKEVTTRNDRSLIDYVLINKGNKQDITDV